MPISNPPNPWATTEVEYLEGAPEVRLEVFEDGTRQHPVEERQPRRRLHLEREPLPRLLSRLRLLLRAPDARVPELRRRDRLRSQDRRQAARGRRCCARRSRKKSWRRRDGRLQRRHRLLPAARGVVPADARLPRGLRRAREPGRRSSPSRRWSSATSTCSPSSARVASAHVTVSIPFWDAERARAIEPYVPTPARRLRVIETLARAGISRRRERRADHSRAQRPGHPEDPGRRARRGRAPGAGTCCCGCPGR